MARRHRLVLIGLLVLLPVGWSVHGAWGCVPQPRLVSVLPSSSGPPGTKVTVDGLGFDPGRAEVRWNTRDGDVLATANGPDFSVEVTIPAAPTGLYALVVLSRRPGGAIGNTARAAFDVTGTDDGEGPVAESTTSVPARTRAAPPGGSSSTTSPDASAAVGLVGAGGAAGVAGTALVHRLRRRRRSTSE